MKGMCFERGRVVIREIKPEKTLKQLHKVFADGSKSPEERMEAFNAETHRESDLVREIYAHMKKAAPNPDNVENILRAVKVLFDRKAVFDEYGI